MSFLPEFLSCHFLSFLSWVHVWEPHSIVLDNDDLNIGKQINTNDAAVSHALLKKIIALDFTADKPPCQATSSTYVPSSRRRLHHWNIVVRLSALSPRQAWSLAWIPIGFRSSSLRNFFRMPYSATAFTCSAAILFNTSNLVRSEHWLIGVNEVSRQSLPNIWR